MDNEVLQSIEKLISASGMALEDFKDDTQDNPRMKRSLISLHINDHLMGKFKNYIITHQIPASHFIESILANKIKDIEQQTGEVIESIDPTTPLPHRKRSATASQSRQLYTIVKGFKEKLAKLKDSYGKIE